MSGATRTIPRAEELQAAGRAAGLDVVEVATAEPFVEVRRTLEERKAAGLHGGMAFTYRQPAAPPTRRSPCRTPPPWSWAPGATSPTTRSPAIDPPTPAGSPATRGTTTTPT